jgi:hypothetical protein
MRKLIYLFLLLTLFLGCQSLRKFSQQEITNDVACTPITFKGKFPTIDVNVNQSKYQFLLDTGAGAPVLHDTLPVVDYKDSDFFSFGSLVGADREKIQSTLFTASLSSTLFESSNKVFLLHKRPAARCGGIAAYSGILGLDVFFHNEQVMKLDFTSGRICNISHAEKNQIINDEKYDLIKSDCKRNAVYIYMTIGEVEYKFKLDTGYTGNIIIPTSKVTPKLLNLPRREYSGSLYNTISSKTEGREILYNSVPVKIGNNVVNSTVSVSSTIKAQNVGIGFIKGLDWIIDYNSDQVFVKRNQHPIPIEPSWNGDYFATIQNDKLIIILKETNQKFDIGDRIVAVNSEKVTKDNICDLQSLLSKTSDWSKLDIEIEKAN